MSEVIVSEYEDPLKVLGNRLDRCVENAVARLNNGKTLSKENIIQKLFIKRFIGMDLYYWDGTPMLKVWSVKISPDPEKIDGFIYRQDIEMLV